MLSRPLSERTTLDSSWLPAVLSLVTEIGSSVEAGAVTSAQLSRAWAATKTNRTSDHGGNVKLGNVKGGKMDFLCRFYRF